MFQIYTTINNYPFINAINDIKRARVYLLGPFKTIKDEYISKLSNLMKALELSFEKSLQNNNNILSFLQILQLK